MTPALLPWVTFWPIEDVMIHSGPDIDLGGLSSGPLGLDLYSDPAVLAIEQSTLFRPGRGLLYLGHDAHLPERGFVRADGDPRVLLTRDERGDVGGLVNLCTHALRPLRTDDEPVSRSCLTCPYHQWSFALDGSLAGHRGFEVADGACRTTERAQRSLPAFETVSWHGMHFAVEPARAFEFTTELAALESSFVERGFGSWLDFGDWTVIAREEESYSGDWKIFMEVYGDCYHVPAYHPGLATFADCASLEWSFGAHHHVQWLPFAPARGASSPAYRAWLDGLDAYHAARGEAVGELAVAWVAVYPNVMVEYYNGLRVISVVIPDGPDRYRNRVTYSVPSDMDTLVPGLAATIKAAYDETAVEDRVLVESRAEGIAQARSLGLDLDAYVVNLSGAGPEAGTAHFHEWWRQSLRT